MQQRFWRRQLLLDHHPADHRLVLLREQQLGRKRLRLWLQLRLQLQLQLQQLQRQLLLNAGRTGRGSASFSAPRQGQALYFLRPDRRTWTKNSGSFIMRPRRRGSLHSR